MNLELSHCIAISQRFFREDNGAVSLKLSTKRVILYRRFVAHRVLLIFEFRFRVSEISRRFMPRGFVEYLFQCPFASIFPVRMFGIFEIFI